MRAHLRKATLRLVLAVGAGLVVSAVAFAGPVGPQRQLSRPAPGDTWSPAVAAAPDGRRALVVWDRSEEPGTSGEIFGRLLDGRGRPLRRPIQISRMGGGRGYFGHDATVAYDPARRRYLVVWSGRGRTERSAPCRRLPPGPEPSPGCREFDNELYARLVSAGGRPLGVQRRITRTGPADRPAFRAHAPDAVYNRRTGEFMVAFNAGERGFPDRADAYVQRIDLAGRPVGRPRRVTDRRGGVAIPRLASHPGSGAYLVAFTWMQPDRGRRDAFARRLDARGRPRGREVRLSEGGAGEIGDVVAAGRGWLVALISRPRTAPPQGLLLRRLDATGRPAGPSRHVPGSQGVVDPSAALAPDRRTRGALLAFIAYKGLDQELHALWIDSRGRPRGRPFQVSRMGADDPSRRPGQRAQTADHGALDSLGSRGFLAAWAGVDDDDRERRELYARRIAP